MRLWFPLPVDVYEELGFADMPAATQNLFVRMVMATARRDGEAVLPKAAMRYVREGGRASGSEKAHIRRLIGAGFVIETEDGKGWAFPTMGDSFSVFKTSQSRRDQARERARRKRAAEAGEPQDGPDVRSLDKTETRPDLDKTSHSCLGGGGPGEEPARSSNSPHNQKEAQKKSSGGFVGNAGFGFADNADSRSTHWPEGSEEDPKMRLPMDWAPNMDSWDYIGDRYPNSDRHMLVAHFKKEFGSRADLFRTDDEWSDLWCEWLDRIAEQ